MSAAESPLASGACRLVLTNTPGAAALACALVRAYAGALGFTPRELDQIELGVEEAVSNVVRHAFPPDEPNQFELTCRATPLGLELLLHDQGLPFDPGRVPDFDPTAEGSAQGGLGMHLMRRVFDEVEYRNLGRGGKETRLVRHRELVPIGERSAAATDAVADEAAEPVDVIRLLDADDALEVARLIHEAYGYSYPYEHIYFPERIAALNASGELCSALAVTSSGRIAGHAALVIDPTTPDRAELAIVVTRMAWRGQGVAQRIGDFLIAHARASGLRLLFTNAVTAHPYTQQFMHQLGFRDTALLPGHAPSSLRFRRINEALAQRESCIYALRYLDERCRAERHLALPAARRELIEEIYASLGIAVHGTPLDGSLAPPTGACLIDTAIHAGLELAQLRLLRWGSDALEVLRARLAQLRRERMAVIELQLPLTEAHTAAALARIEALGFLFSGILPGVDAGDDRLVLDFIADPGFDFDAPKIHSALGQRLRTQMREQALGNA